MPINAVYMLHVTYTAAAVVAATVAAVVAAIDAIDR